MKATKNELATTESGMVLIEGVLEELHVDVGSQNLLEQVDRHYRGSATALGAAAAASDLYAQFASAASVAMYDGEDVQNFICLLGGQVMCGQFAGAQWLKNGQRVKAVVSRRDGVLLAHAVIAPSAGLLWTSHPWGSKAETLANWRIAFWCFSFGMFCAALCAGFIGTNAWTFWEGIAWSAIGLATICGGVAIWANRDMRALADPATEAFRLLGFADAERINLNAYRIGTLALRALSRGQDSFLPEALDQSGYQKRDVYSYKHAERDGKIAFA
ncbi:MAG: hypothetical protein EPO01_00150 [Aquabacterium sp.]|nr:MAG: hypothetical protein EPO01_00150 [Aquabacterium sp.]